MSKENEVSMFRDICTVTLIIELSRLPMKQKYSLPGDSRQREVLGQRPMSSMLGGHDNEGTYVVPGKC